MIIKKFYHKQKLFSTYLIFQARAAVSFSLRLTSFFILGRRRGWVNIFFYFHINVLFLYDFNSTNYHFRFFRKFGFIASYNMNHIVSKFSSKFRTFKLRLPLFRIVTRLSIIPGLIYNWKNWGWFSTRCKVLRALIVG